MTNDMAALTNTFQERSERFLKPKIRTVLGVMGKAA